MGYIPGDTLFGFPYDWRQSNSLNSTLDRLAETLERISKGRKIDVVSHSMGGLVMRSFIAKYPDLFKKHVRSWMTLGTPAGGAAKSLFAIITGYNFDNPFVSNDDALAFATDCPTLYELFSDPRTTYKTPPKITFKTATKTVEHNIQELPADILNQVLNNFEFEDLAGNKLNRSYNPVLYQNSKYLKQVWKNVSLPNTTRYYNIYSDTTPTPFDFVYETDQKTDDLSVFRATEPKIGLSSGDGTVPTESAMQDGFEAYRRVVVDATHMGLVKSHDVFNWVRSMVKLPCIMAGEWNMDGVVFDIQSIGNWMGGMIPYEAGRIRVGGQIEAGSVRGTVSCKLYTC